MLRRLNAGKTKKVCAIIKIKQVIFVSVLSLSQLYDRDMNKYIIIIIKKSIIT